MDTKENPESLYDSKVLENNRNSLALNSLMVENSYNLNFYAETII